MRNVDFTKKYTNAKGLRAYRLRKDGNSYSEIAKKIGNVSIDSIRLWCFKVAKEKGDTEMLATKRKTPRRSGNGKSRTINKADILRDWFKTVPQRLNMRAVDAYGQFSRETGVKMQQPYFNTLRRKLREANKAKGREIRATVVKRANTMKKSVDLQKEVDYLRWWNQGERSGWVDRLLNEVQK